MIMRGWAARSTAEAGGGLEGLAIAAAYIDTSEGRTKKIGKACQRQVND
jgi:hypothetical protein